MAECGLGQERGEDLLPDVEDRDESDDEDDFPSDFGSDDEDDFPPDFKEYMGRELKYSRLTGWVFWNRQDDDFTLSDDHSVDSSPDVCASRKVRVNISHALHKFISHSEFKDCLVQFWAPTKTSEGRTLLTTQFQPFALGSTCNTYVRKRLCEYRMGMCREYNNFFYADAECAQELLGLPGRVFLHQRPEYNTDVLMYNPEDYPQQDLAVRCGIKDSWGLPVFERSSHTCVGVLEMVRREEKPYELEFLGRMYGIFQEFDLRCFDGGYKHCKMQFGDESGGKNEAHMAFQELEMVYESLHKIHKLNYILTWVSCRSCNDLLHIQHVSSDKFKCFSWNLRDSLGVYEHSVFKKGQVTGRILPFPNLLYCSDVRGLSVGESPLVPYPAQVRFLVGCFTMCLQSSYTGDELYVLEFFFPKSDKNDENILTRLRLILGTMEKILINFKLASGQRLGEELPVEVIDFQYGQRSHSIQKIPATRFIPSLELLQDGGVMLQQAQQDQPSMDAINNGMYVVSEAQNDNLPSLDSLQNGKVTTQVDSSNQPSMDASSNGQNVVTAERNIFVVSSSKEHERKTQDRKHKKGGPRIDIPKEEILECSHMNRKDVAEKLRVGISTFKRVCRGYGIDRWPPRNIEKIQSSLPSSVENQGQTPQLNFDFPSNQASGTVANIKTGFQDADTVTIRAKCETNTIKFRLSLSSKLEELQQQVAKRLNLKAETYHIKYKDEKDEMILIAIDEDLQECMQSLGNNDIYITLELLNSS